MKRLLALALVLGLCACNRHGVADVTLDAAAAQRNGTSAKTLADLQAAADASQGPAPIVHDARPAAAPRAEAAPIPPKRMRPPPRPKTRPTPTPTDKPNSAVQAPQTRNSGCASELFGGV